MKAALSGLALLLAVAGVAPGRSASSDPAGAPAGRYELDGRRARLTARVHVGFWRYPVRFQSLSGSFDYDPANWKSTRVRIVVDPKSMDGRLAGGWSVERFFEPEKYPVIRFASTGLSPTDDGRGQLAGELTLHGVTRPVTLSFVFHGVDAEPGTPARLSFSGTGRIRRSDFRLTGGRPFAGDQIDLQFNADFVRATSVSRSQAADRAPY